MEHVRCIGVPEHFNLPWHLAIESGAFKEQGVTLLWNDEPKGTGAMCRSLAEGSTDLAIMVSAGTVRECLRNPDIRIIATYVESPLNWGIHVPSSSKTESLEGLSSPRFAISRFNSGSHLMAHYFCSTLGLELCEEDFELVHDLNGARKRFAEGPELLFLWEKFTTDFLVELGEFKRIGEVLPPWPCFMIAARKTVIDEQSESLAKVLNVVQHSAMQLKKSENGIQRVAERYHIPMNKAAEWWQTVNWSKTGNIDKNAIDLIANTLSSLGVLENPPTEQELHAIVAQVN